VEFRILGPVEVHDAGQRVDTGRAQQRAVLAVLLLELGHVITADQLVDRVWGSEPPASAHSAVYGHVARLRTAIGAGPDQKTRLARRAGGYVLEAPPEQADLFEFRRLAASATASDAEQDAAELWRDALSLWRGRALTGVASPWLDRMRDALELERRTATLNLADISLRQGRHGALASELAELAEASPGDERLVGQLMLALYRSGRAADALLCFERTRRYLADELGADPEPRLRQLHQQIRRGDRSLDWPGPASDGTRGTATSPGTRVAGRERTESRAGRPVPRELPADVPAFTGRAAELAELNQLLDNPAQDGEPGSAVASAVISAVAGTGGVGKTALAVRWAHQAADRFPDGQLYLDLRGYDPAQPVTAADALGGFLSSLGVAAQDIPADLEQRAARYRSLLAGLRVLVVLDNASHVEQVRPLLPGSPTCRVLVTSRDALAGLVTEDGAQRLDLDLLPMADAVALLRTVIGVRVDAQPQAAQTLAGQCAQLPLALRVAAERAVAQPGLPLADLTAELADEQGRLDLLQAGADPRTAVRTVFSWSCKHLDPAAVHGFGLLGLHPGPDLEPYAAAAIADAQVPQAQRLLTVLTRAHLIQPSPAGPGRYAMHDLLRAYARELAAAIGEQQLPALTRLLDHYLHTAAAAMRTLYPAEQQSRPDIPAAASPVPPVADMAAARAWLDANLTCLVAAAAQACGYGLPGHAIHLARILWRHLISIGAASEAITLCTCAVTAARNLGDRAVQANALVDLGAAEFMRSRFQEANKHLQQALILAREAGERAAQARALGNLGNVGRAQGRYQEAAGYYQQALAVDREAGGDLAQARALSNLGAVTRLQGHYDVAAGYLRQALTSARETGDRIVETLALSELGYCETAVRSYRQAAGHLVQSLALAREIGWRMVEAHCFGGLGQVQFGRGRRPQATVLLQQAVTLCRESGDRSGEAEMLGYLGEVQLADGQPEQAGRHYAAALGLAAHIGDQYQQARAHHGLATCGDATGDHDQARDHWRQALAILVGIGSAEADQVRARLAALGADPHQIACSPPEVPGR
jgi:DNA-binding SARP family transcriptional activator/Tfp pilus assembly protein PilF